MIPKKIHYCWFGGKEKPESVKRCLRSWKTHLPDYEIIEWNENNFHINSYVFVKEAYNSGKFGFIVDVLRMYVLKQQGGIYLDTDVEFIRPLPEKFLDESAFGCYEVDNLLNVGLIASEKNGKFVNDILKLYENKHFLKEDGSLNTEDTGPKIATEFLKQKAYKLEGKQECKDNYFNVFPADYFSPKDYKTGLCEITDNTVCIHLYDASWVDNKTLGIFYNNQKKNRVIKAIKDCESFMTKRAILGLVRRTLNIKLKDFL